MPDTPSPTSALTDAAIGLVSKRLATVSGTAALAAFGHLTDHQLYALTGLVAVCVVCWTVERVMGRK